MKKFFGKVRGWWSRHKPSKRRLIQLYAALLYNANIKGFFTGNIYTGGTKYFCVPGLNCYSCPGAVGACPLGALQNALAQSKTSSSYYILGILVLFGLLLGRTICGFLCPIGLCQEMLYKIKTPKLKKSRVTRVLSYLKYVLLAALVVALPLVYSFTDGTVPAFCKYVCPAGTFGGAIMLLLHPSNAELFGALGPLFTWKFAVLVALSVASVFIFRAFCRFFCPLGAIYSFFNKIALIGVKLDKNACTNCGLCVSHCKMDVKRVGDHECINCGECIPVCPAKAISWKGSKLFVHANASPIPIAQTDAPRPLSAFLDGSARIPAENGTETVEAGETSAAAVRETAARGEEIAVAQAEVSGTEKPEETAVREEIAATQAETAGVVAGKGRGRAFWLQFAAWAAAIVALIGALLYYNVFREGEKRYEVGNEPGNLCPEFVLPALQGEGTEFSVSGQRGKVVVLNFWTTYCDPCKEEIPEFERLQKEYSDEITVAIIHGVDVIEDVAAFIKDSMNWGDYESYFLQDTEEAQMYKTLGGGGTWPMTVILDREGVIRYRHLNKISYEIIKSEIETLIG